MATSVNKTSLPDRVKETLPLVIVTGAAVFLDQLTKAIVRKTVAFGGTIEVIKGFLEISYSENTGAAFGIFRGQNRIFIVIGLLAIGFIFIYYRQFRESIWMKISLGLILGGALGNLIDRIFFRFVTDFIRIRIWFFRPIWWPSFNIADATLCIGAVMLAAFLLRTCRLKGDMLAK